MKALDLHAALATARALVASLEAAIANSETAPGPSESEWLPLSRTGISIRTLRAAIKAGELPASKVGREYRVRRSDMTTWVAGRRVSPRATTAVATSPAERALARATAEGRLRSVGGGR